MKFLKVLLAGLLLLPTASAQKAASMPKPTEYVDDYANVLTPTGTAEIERICHEIHAKTKAQIFFVTINSLNGEPIENFANDLFHTWKIGQKGTDRGILLLLAVKDHKRRIEVGYGFEGILPDAKAGRIGRDMVPALKDSDYDEAGLIGVREIAQVIAEDSKVTLDSVAPTPAAPVEQLPPPVQAAPSTAEINGIGWGLPVLFLLLFGGFGLFILLTIRRYWGSSRSPRGYYDPNQGNTFTSYEPGYIPPPPVINDSSSSGGFFGGGDSGSSFSSSSDSFSGGDGGDSGGGGASGDW